MHKLCGCLFLYWLYACLWLLGKPQGTLSVCCDVPRGKNLLAGPPEGCDGGGGGGRGNRDTFPVEIGLSLHQLLLQLQRGACRSLGMRPIGIQMGAHERALKNDLTHILHTKTHTSLWQQPHRLTVSVQRCDGEFFKHTERHLLQRAVLTGRWIKLWFWRHQLNCENGFGVVFAILITTKTLLLCLGIFSYIHPCPGSNTHTQRAHTTVKLLPNTLHTTSGLRHWQTRPTWTV